MNDLLGGQVDFMCDPTTNTPSQIKSGKVNVFGVTSKMRVAAYFLKIPEKNFDASALDRLSASAL